MRKGDHYGFTRIVLLLAVCIMLYGCDAPPEQTAQTTLEKSTKPLRGGTYRLPLSQNPASLDPAYVRHNYGIAVVHQLFDGLVRFDRYLTPHPALAETWRIEDNGLAYIFTLRKNVRFHNDQALTVEDVVFSLGRLLRIKPAPAIVPHLIRIEGASAYRDHHSDHIAGLEPLGSHTLRIKLKEVHGPFLTALAMYQAMIVPKKAVTANPAHFNRNPIGSGPFRFISWETDRSIQLERFDGYYQGESLLDRIDFRIYTAQQHQRVLSDFIKGSLDEMPVFSDEVKKALSGRKELQWFHRPSMSLFFYGINCERPPLNEPLLRQTLSASIDRQKLVDKVFNGRFETAQTILPPGMPGYQPPDRPLAERMRDAMPPAGTGKMPADELKEIEIVSAYETPRVQAEMSLVRAAWREQGVQLKTRFIPDWNAFNDYIRSDTVQVYRYGWTADMPDPDSILYPLFASDSPDNFMHFNHPQVDRLLNAARGKIDPVERTALYRQAEKLILTSAPLIPLFHLSVDRVYQAAVKNAQPSALGAHTMSLHKVWLNRSPAN